MTVGLLRVTARQALRASLAVSKPVSSVACHTDERKVIGNREVVGYGVNGESNYIDRVDFPLPAIRYKEENDEIKALRIKEKDDWNKLTMDEKKALYRASFCQTFAEIQAPTGEWKQILGGSLLVMTLALWYYIFVQKFVLDELPPSLSPEAKQAQLEFMIKARVDPIDGLSSKWDYEKGQWKE